MGKLPPTTSGRARLLAATALLAGVTGPVHSANWEWASRATLNANWNNNPALVVDSRDPESTFRMVAGLAGNLVRLADGSTLEFRPRVTRDYYPDEKFKDLESTDFFLPGRYNQQRLRSSWSLGWNATRQNVLSDEDTLADEPVTSLNADDTVYRLRLSPAVSWIMTQRDQLSLLTSLSKTEFDKEFTGRADTEAAVISVSYSHSLDQNQSVGFSVFRTQFRSERLDRLRLDGLPPLVRELENETTSDSFSLDYRRRISERSRVFVRFGLQESETQSTQTIVETGESGETPILTFESTTYEIGFDRETLRGSWEASINRGVSPATNGSPQDRYEIRFGGRLDFSKKLSGSLKLRARQQQRLILSEQGSESGKDRFYSANVRAAWKLDRKWRLTATYRFRFRQPDSASENSATARSDQVLLGFTYVWKPLRR